MKNAVAKLLCAALWLALACGCAPAAPTEDEGLRLWFLTQGRQLTAALDSCPYEGAATVPAMLDALLAGPPEEETELAAPIPAGTRVLSWSVEQRVAHVELSAAYAGLVGVDLTLADYCITLTLAQLPGVDGVRVTASGAGQSYRERHVLYPGDVLFSGAEETPVEVTAALYFRREGGDSLGFELRVFRLTQDKVPAKAVLEALLAGPKEEGLAPLLPAGLSVRSVWVDSGVCCADLSAQLLELPEGERGQAVDSIVATLCSLDTVEQVQLLVEGESPGQFGGRDLSQPVRPSLREEN